MRSVVPVALAATLAAGLTACTTGTPTPGASSTAAPSPAAAASSPAAAAPTATVSPTPSAPSLASAVEVGSPLRLRLDGAQVTVTLARADLSSPGAEPPRGDSFWMDLTVRVRTGSWTFDPDRVSYFGSRDTTREPMGLVEGKPGPTVVTAGQTRRWRLSYGMPAVGPNGDLMFALADESGRVLGHWRDAR